MDIKVKRLKHARIATIPTTFHDFFSEVSADFLHFPSEFRILYLLTGVRHSFLASGSTCWRNLRWTSPGHCDSAPILGPHMSNFKFGAAGIIVSEISQRRKATFSLPDYSILWDDRTKGCEAPNQQTKNVSITYGRELLRFTFRFYSLGLPFTLNASSFWRS